MATNLETWENFENPEMDIRSELSNLDEEIRENDVDQGDNKEVKEKSFTFKPISVGVGGSRIKNGEKWGDNVTTQVEFAGGGKNLSLYGYARKDWNKYANGFNEGIELFATENLKLGKNFDLNGKQFYWGKGNGKLMVGPQISIDKQLGNVGVGASAGVYGAYDVVSGSKNSISGSGVVSVNFSVKGKDGKTRKGDAFIHVSGIKGFNANEYGAYGEANLQTPNLLDPKAAGALCGMLYARYGGNIKNIELSYFGVGMKYEF